MKETTLPNARSSPVSQFVQIVRQGALPALRLLARPSTLAQIPRLFGEGLGPARRLFIQAANDREMARLVREGESITFVSSLLRCGSTWMCYLLCDVLLQNNGIQTTTEMPVDRKRIVLDPYARLIARRDKSVRTPGYIIKTHDLVPELQARIGGDAGVRRCHYLYLYRAPEDALVSTCYLFRREKYLHNKPLYELACRDIDLFCIESVPEWIERFKSYLDAMEEGVDVHLVRYDQLLRQTCAVLGDTLDWIGLPHTPAMLARAQSNMEFSKLQAMEAKTLGKQIPFFRRGQNGSGKLELKPETVARIRDATQSVMARADERLARQAAARQFALAEPMPAEPGEVRSRNGQSRDIPACSSR